jgi:threonylcarbamoyladenosine tRNA methylthiotransferase MtaB
MRRTYSSDFYRSLLEHIEKQVPGIALGADVMVGFPGEGEQEFQNTMRLVAESPLTHLHVFSYSRRPGTTAADMQGQVSEEIKKVRNEALRKLARDKNLCFQMAQLGQELDVVIESRIDARTGCLTGLTDNYIRVHIPNAKNESVGKKVLVRLNEAKEQDIFASVV